jgi:signal transduction histidine kinase
VSRKGDHSLELAVALCGVATFDADPAVGTLVCSARLLAILGLDDRGDPVAPRDADDSGVPRTLDAFFERVHAEDAARARHAFAQAVRSDAPFDLECRLRRASGEYAWIHARAGRFVDDDGTERVSGVVVDVTARKRVDEERSALEAQLRRAQRRVERLATLAGGIAHEFNNLLAPMLGNAQILRRAFAVADPRHGLTEDIVQAALKARELVRRIVVFSHRHDVETPSGDSPADLPSA